MDCCVSEATATATSTDGQRQGRQFLKAGSGWQTRIDALRRGYGYVPKGGHIKKYTFIQEEVNNSVARPVLLSATDTGTTLEEHLDSCDCFPATNDNDCLPSENLETMTDTEVYLGIKTNNGLAFDHRQAGSTRSKANSCHQQRNNRNRLGARTSAVNQRPPSQTNNKRTIEADKKLNERINNIHNERAAVDSLRRQLEAAVSEALREKAEYRLWKESEQAKFEARCEEEVRRLQHRQRAKEAQQKALAQFPNRQARQKIEALQAELAQLQDTMVTKETRHTLSVDRLTRRIKELEIVIADLKEELRICKHKSQVHHIPSPYRGEHEAAKARVGQQHALPLQKVDRLQQRQQEEASAASISHRVASPQYSPYAYMSVELCSTPEQVSSEEVQAAAARNSLDQHVSMMQHHQHHFQHQPTSPPALSIHSDGNNGDGRETRGEIITFKSCNHSPLLPADSTFGEADFTSLHADVHTLKDQDHNERYPSRLHPAAASVTSEPCSYEDINTTKTLQSSTETTMEQSHASTCRSTQGDVCMECYDSGAVCWKWLSGCLTVYPNGDVKQCTYQQNNTPKAPKGEVIEYFFADLDAWQVSHPSSGVEVFYLRDGRAEAVLPGGIKEVLFVTTNDWEAKGLKILPDGRQLTATRAAHLCPEIQRPRPVIRKLP